MPTLMRPLTTGQLLDRTFQTYRQNFTLFAGISAVPQLCLLLVQLCVLAALGGPKVGSTGAVVITAIVGIVTVIISVVVSSMATAGTTFAVSDTYLEKPTSISSCFSRVKGKIGRVIYVSIAYSLTVGIGFVLLIVPGIYWAGKYGLAVPSVVLEDIKGKEACPRSAVLTKDSVGRILSIYFLTWILIVGISMALNAVLVAIAPSLGKAAGTTTAHVVEYLLTAVINTLVTPVMSIALTLAYYDQRVRKEAFDIVNMMTLLGEPAPASEQMATQPE
jgi:hypothetical protein